MPDLCAVLGRLPLGAQCGCQGGAAQGRGCSGLVRLELLWRLRAASRNGRGGGRSSLNAPQPWTTRRLRPPFTAACHERGAPKWLGKTCLAGILQARPQPRLVPLPGCPTWPSSMGIWMPPPSTTISAPVTSAQRTEQPRVSVAAGPAASSLPLQAHTSASAEMQAEAHMQSGRREPIVDSTGDGSSQSLARLARKRAGPATSSGTPSRPAGTRQERGARARRVAPVSCSQPTKPASSALQVSRPRCFSENNAIGRQARGQLKGRPREVRPDLSLGTQSACSNRLQHPTCRDAPQDLGDLFRGVEHLQRGLGGWSAGLRAARSRAPAPHTKAWPARSSACALHSRTAR